jgi:nucleoside-diphosphate-sugar epimerase
MSELKQARSVAITGALGNLGSKLIDYLIRRKRTPRIVGLDLHMPTSDYLASLRQLAAENAVDGKTTAIDFVSCDLAEWHDQHWRTVLEEVEAVVHFAARNPYPEATWDEAGVSLDMTLHVAQAAADSPTVDRFVFATSNHVMGRYKDPPLAGSVGPGELRPGSDPAVGTVWHTGERWMDSTPYATAKFAGERVCRALAERTGGKTTFVAIRIGWCQPGENRTDTLSASGSPTLRLGVLPPELDPADFARSERWFSEMWLSNRDFVHLFERALRVNGDNWPHPFLLVNGMSANQGMKWSLDETKRWLDYRPQDNVYVEKDKS